MTFLFVLHTNIWRYECVRLWQSILDFVSPKSKLHQHSMSWSRQCLVLLKLLFLKDFFSEVLIYCKHIIFSKRTAVQTQQAFSSTPEHPAHALAFVKGQMGATLTRPAPLRLSQYLLAACSMPGERKTLMSKRRLPGCSEGPVLKCSLKDKHGACLTFPFQDYFLVLKIHNQLFKP